MCMLLIIRRVASHNQLEGHQQTEEGHRAAEGVDGVGCGSPSPENFEILSLEKPHFGAFYELLN